MSTFTGTGRLVRLAVRRDRVLLPVWLLTITGLTVAIVASVSALYSTAAERAAAAAFGAANVTARIIDGPTSGTDLGALVMVEVYGIVSILVALMSVQVVVRHTRQDEETGRAELLAAAAVGRHARLTAALLVALGANLLLAVMIAATLLAHGFAPVGSVASAAAIAAVGSTFAGVAAVTAQLAASQSGATGLAVVGLGVAFLLRAAGDAFGHVAPSGVVVISAWPSWLSPLGWGQQVRAFHEHHWDVFGLFAALFIGLVGLAFALTNRRDVGTGILHPRPGPTRASARLLSPLGLAWRLHRATLLAWAAGLTVIGAVFGAIGESAGDLANVSQQLVDLIQATGTAELVDLYFGFVMGFLGVAAAGYPIQALLRMRTEEAAGRLEPVLATGVSRGRWLASHLVVTTLGTLLVLTLTGAAGATAYGIVAGDFPTGLGFLWAAWAQLPAVFVLAGVVVMVFGTLPRWAGALAWAALAASLLVGQLGGLFELPQPLLNLSPFTHIPVIPAEDFTLTPVVVLLVVSLALTGAGLAWFRRRDLAIGA